MTRWFSCWFRSRTRGRLVGQLQVQAARRRQFAGQLLAVSAGCRQFDGQLPAVVTGSGCVGHGDRQLRDQQILLVNMLFLDGLSRGQFGRQPGDHHRILVGVLELQRHRAEMPRRGALGLRRTFTGGVRRRPVPA